VRWHRKWPITPYYAGDCEPKGVQHRISCRQLRLSYFGSVGDSVHVVHQLTLLAVLL